jgi:hypothetical protein
MNATIDEARLKQLFKEAVVEVLEERRELLRDLFAETLEDMALVRAIEDGEKSGRASRKDVFKALAGKA